MKRFLIGLLSTFFLACQTGISTAFAAAPDYCGALEKANPGKRLPDYCRPKYSYTAITVLGSLAAAGAAMMLAGAGNGDKSPESPIYSQADDDRSATLPNLIIPKGIVDIDAWNKVLASPDYNKQVHNYTNFDDYEAIGLSYSLARGFYGNGEKVAVMDTGVAGTSAEPNPAWNSSNPTWHGTAVASLIAAAAPDSEIMAYRLTDDSGNFASYGKIANMINSAAESGANVINNSWGLPNLGAGNVYDKNNLIMMLGNGAAEFMDAIENAAKKGTVFVWAAGNEGRLQPTALAALPLFLDGIQNNFINVVAFDTEKGSIANFSNRCGITKDFCLAAPGADIVFEIFKKNNIDIPMDSFGDGTSFAAPIVAGSVATILGAHPFLSGSAATKILFMTARDLGAKGVDETYGWGLLDLEKASRPVGELSIGNAVFRMAEVSGDSVIGNAVKNADVSAVFTDSFGRGFSAYIGNSIVMQRKPKSLDALRKFGDKKSNELVGRNIRNPFFLNDADTDAQFGKTFGNIGFNFAYQKYNLASVPTEENRADMISASTTFSFGGTTLEFGAMVERNAMLGSNISGEWLGLGQNSKTAMFGLDQDIKIADDATIALRADFGMTMPETSENSIITGVSAIAASAYSAELNYGDFSFSISRPLSVMSGEMDLTLPVSQNGDGTLNYEQRKLSLQNNPAFEYGMDYKYKNMNFGMVYSDGELMLLFRIKEII